MNQREKYSGGIEFESEEEEARFLQLIRERIAMADADPGSLIPHEEVFAESRARLLAKLQAEQHGDRQNKVGAEGDSREE